MRHLQRAPSLEMPLELLLLLLNLLLVATGREGFGMRNSSSAAQQARRRGLAGLVRRAPY